MQELHPLRDALHGRNEKGEFRRTADEAAAELSLHAISYAELCPTKQVALALAGGAFVTVGALLSVVLTEGVEAQGVRQLLIGAGFAAGFSLVILTGSLLFTEINVALPALMFALGPRRAWPHVWRVWATVLLGNAAGALAIAAMVRGAGSLTVANKANFVAIVAKKLERAEGSAGDWFAVLLSGVLGNWLVGTAAFVASSARTVTGKVAGVFYPVVAFAALGFQHSPANMGYLFTALLHSYDNDEGVVTWANVIGWNLVPAAIGNVIGGAVMVAGLFTYAYAPEARDAAAGRPSAASGKPAAGGGAVEMADTLAAPPPAAYLV